MREILVIEDNEELRDILKEALSTDDYIVKDAPSAEEGLEIFKERSFDIVITDLKLPEKDGIDVLKEVKRTEPAAEVIIITAYGTVDRAVSAMKHGASDFITKPFSLDQIRIQVEKILKTKITKEENTYLKKLVRGEIMGKSPEIKRIMEFIAKISEKEATVLITGESGTGKELVAQEIHAKSKRREYPLIKVNCAALAPGVLESELFGHEKGAFTDALFSKKGRFELADGGTIFLDEIADLPVGLQVKLLRVIQQKEFERVGGEKTIRTNVRIIAATNKDLKQAVSAGRFREELYYRLNVIEVKMPPLRERKDDISLLVDYFIKKYSDYSGFKVRSISKDALQMLVDYNYPGNIRELENIIQRMLVTASSEIIEPEDVPHEIQVSAGSAAVSDGLNSRVEEYEKGIIINALKDTGGNKLKAAEILKVNRATLLARIKKYKINSNL